jgi:hypothetical protein
MYDALSARANVERDNAEVTRSDGAGTGSQKAGIGGWRTVVDGVDDVRVRLDGLLLEVPDEPASTFVVRASVLATRSWRVPGVLAGSPVAERGVHEVGEEEDVHEDALRDDGHQVLRARRGRGGGGASPGWRRRTFGR